MSRRANWVCMEAKVPLHVEIANSGTAKDQLHVVANDCEWDGVTDVAEFGPITPDDYTLGQPMPQSDRADRRNVYQSPTSRAERKGWTRS